MRINKYIFTILIIFLVTACAHIVPYDKNYSFDKIRRVGVISFVDYQDQTSSGEAIADEWTRQLMLKNIEVVERAQLENVLREEILTASGMLTPETVQKISKLLGVDVLIMGTIIKYSPEEKYVVILSGHEKRKEISSKDLEKSLKDKIEAQLLLTNAEVGVSARMVDVKTGKVVWSDTFTYNAFDIQTAINWVVNDLIRSLSQAWPDLKK